uniref:Uncharacterized protein n=1 Tax=Acrobeloides nanus TaxID=290746 RepID=A0A914C381_9BILA
METLNFIIQIWLLNHVSPPAISTFILIDQAILNQLNQSDTAATVPEKMFFASTYWPIWNASYDQVDSIKIVDNPDKSYLIFDLPNESRAIKRFPTNSTNVQLKNGADVELLFPSNVDEFMWRWNNGRFLLCHIEEGRKTTKFTTPMNGFVIKFRLMPKNKNLTKQDGL